MKQDPVNPILHNKHYPALERRLGKSKLFFNLPIILPISVMKYLLNCMESKPIDRIVMAEFHNPNIPVSNTDEEEQSEEGTVDQKDDKKTV